MAFRFHGFCGVGRRRSSTRMSGTRWTWTTLRSGNHPPDSLGKPAPAASAGAGRGETALRHLKQGPKDGPCFFAERGGAGICGSPKRDSGERASLRRNARGYLPWGPAPSEIGKTRQDLSECIEEARPRRRKSRLPPAGKGGALRCSNGSVLRQK